MRGPPAENEFGKLAADKRGKETPEENTTAEDAEKNGEARSVRRPKQNDSDSDTHCRRGVDSRRGLHKTNNADKDVWNCESDDALNKQQQRNAKRQDDDHT